jgi:hypothetical protein
LKSEHTGALAAFDVGLQQNVTSSEEDKKSIHVKTISP